MIKETDTRAKAWRKSLKRTYHVKGSPREVGFALGQALGERLERNIARYIETGPARHGVIDRERLRNGALPWLRGLPQRYQEEFEGLAEGANVPLQRLAEWCFVEECVQDGCSAVVWLLEGRAWVARNNDLWGYMTIRAHRKREPVGNWIVGTNHTCTAGAPELDDPQTASRRRFERIEELLQQFVGACGGGMDVSQALMGILADPGVEVRGEDYGTVYASVTCPSQCMVWYTFGGYPAASSGAWYEIVWPWDQGPNMPRGRLLLLNGVSSSGKSSIAKVLQGMLEEPCVHCIDPSAPRANSR